MSSLSINKNVELKAGMEWINASFFIFREAPVQFIILGILSTVSSLIPAFGAFMTVFFMSNFISLTAKVVRGEKIPFGSIFDGLFTSRNLFNLALLNLAFNVIILVAKYIVENSLKQSTITPLGSSVVLFFIVPVLILQLAIWLSPAICLYNEEISPIQAMILSIQACCSNVATLLLYSLLVIAFTLLALVTLGLGLFIWLPMLNIITYFIYHSLFVKEI